MGFLLVTVERVNIRNVDAVHSGVGDRPVPALGSAKTGYSPVARLLATDCRDAVRSTELLTAKSGTSQRCLCFTAIDACTAQLELKYEIQQAVPIDVSHLELSGLCTFGAKLHG